MCFSEYESVYLIGHVISILNKEDVAREEDVERYVELHPEFEYAFTDPAQQSSPCSPPLLICLVCSLY